MNNTINIEDTIQEINRQNKRIEELCLEIERLNNIINTLLKELEEYLGYEEYDRVEKDTFIKVIKRIEELKEKSDKE